MRDPQAKARKLGARWGGLTDAEKRKVEQRNVDMWEAHDEGESYSSLARNYRLSRQRVRQIVKKVEKAVASERRIT